MLVTPLGPIKILVNEQEIDYQAIRCSLNKSCRDVDGRFLIQYPYRSEFGIQKIRCCLPNINGQGDIESGERFESISFYKNLTKLTIGIEASFGMEEEDGYDYSGRYLNNGIEYETNVTTDHRIFQFGISWIQPCTEENDHQTWYGADMTL
ncbi:hypothetical protein [Ornithinibacillus halophilus]|uniref:Uncharacterized protein n=1 Tax=Ornithinibacillus halophilus TaxID=930117 RepID=A0A1M5N0F1_9BACI|nr:hypothetical protein [Ornithinibacillus halophilus]SHG83040.1 hypothetical protein SAMN05216225_106819 [Ornithinibacillus halophilus]